MRAASSARAIVPENPFCLFDVDSDRRCGLKEFRVYQDAALRESVIITKDGGRHRAHRLWIICACRGVIAASSLSGACRCRTGPNGARLIISMPNADGQECCRLESGSATSSSCRLYVCR